VTKEQEPSGVLAVLLHAGAVEDSEQVDGHVSVAVDVSVAVAARVDERHVDVVGAAELVSHG